MSRPGIYTPVSCPVNLKVKIFFAENWDFIPKVAEVCLAGARCLPDPGDWPASNGPIDRSFGVCKEFAKIEVREPTMIDLRY